MSSREGKNQRLSKAEIKFRDAFERLKMNQPEILPKGTPVSQNNVAKEAGVDPSALRSSRYPQLSDEIRSWRAANPDSKREQSAKHVIRAARNKHLDLKDRIDLLTKQRDEALSRLLDAQTYLVELMRENRELRDMLPDNNVRHIHSYERKKL